MGVASSKSDSESDLSGECRISLGLHPDGAVVHVGELDHISNRGLRCECTCAACGDRLVAKLGQIRQHHFAHYRRVKCSGGDESALHRFAKEVFQAHSQFKVPAAEIHVGIEHATISPAAYVSYVEAIPEKRVADVIPDITLLRRGESPMLVEIRVTHEVDAVKTEKLEALGLPVIEIDLGHTYRELVDGNFDRDRVIKLLIESDGIEKKWICIPNHRQYEDMLRARLQQTLEAGARAAEEAAAQQRAAVAELLERRRAAEELRQRAERENQARLLEEYRTRKAKERAEWARGVKDWLNRPKS